MSENNKGKIWVYAVVLFTSAFIVLLITAFSQLRFNKSIENYRLQISDSESEKNKFLINLNSALDQNMKLEQQIKELEEELKKLEEKVSELETVNSRLADERNNVNRAYELLLLAFDDFNKGNFVSCAERLTEINTSYLDDSGRKQYGYLVSRSYTKAAHELYSQGYGYYKKKNYALAVENFRRSLKFASDEYFVDDCYYLLGLSEYMLGNMENAKTAFKTIVEKYPDGSYLDAAEDYLKQIGE